MTDNTTDRDVRLINARAFALARAARRDRNGYVKCEFCGHVELRRTLAAHLRASHAAELLAGKGATAA